jgi:hypothetical protein
MPIGYLFFMALNIQCTGGWVLGRNIRSGLQAEK